jgi:adenylosuccinate lyase
MSAETSLEELTQELREEHGFSNETISLLSDKGLGQKEFQRLREVLNLPNETFEERRKKKSWIERNTEEGDSEEITAGRYNKYLRAFKDISSEQALVQGRMKFAVEYVVALVKLLAEHPDYRQLVKRPFNGEEEEKLRSIYKNFYTKDFLATKIIESRTKHDIVAANTWVTVRAQQLGLDDNLMRRLVHFARTSADVNTNVVGELYTRAIGQWTESVISLLNELEKKAVEYAEATCVGETHLQDAQLTTVGHIYANIAEQIALHAEPLLKEEKLRLDGKIAGAIGTDADMMAAFPGLDTFSMYKTVVEDFFGLKCVELGNDQDCTNAALSQVLDTMINVDLKVKKAATDLSLYASRGIIGKITSKGESGSSVMPQKANPFLAEGCEALIPMASGEIPPLKDVIAAYREQGDLRRSVALREGFHPIMLKVIAIERLIEEMRNYKPNIIAIEKEVYEAGPKIISSQIQTFLKKEGIPDAYDRMKRIVMKPYVRAGEIRSYLDKMVNEEAITGDIASKVTSMLNSVMDMEGNMRELEGCSDPEYEGRIIERLTRANKNEVRKGLLGNAIANTYRMIVGIKGTKELLSRYIVFAD